MIKKRLFCTNILLKGFLIFVCLGITGCAISLTPEANDDDSWLSFIDQENNYSINYPNGWSARKLLNGNREDKDAVALITSPSILSATIIIAQRADIDSTEENAIAWGESRIQQRYEHNELLDIEVSTTINNQTLLTRMYRSSINSPTPVKGKDVYINRMDDIVVLTLLTNESFFEDVVATFDEMTKSFITLNQ